MVLLEYTKVYFLQNLGLALKHELNQHILLEIFQLGEI